MNTVQIHNYMFWNYNEMEEGFVGDYEGDGDGDDRDRCLGLPDRSGEDGGSLLLVPPPDSFRRLGFLVCFRDGGCSTRRLGNPKPQG